MKRYSGTNLPVILAALVLVLGLSAVTFGQEETAATITGQVTDSTGAIVAGATVVITNETTRQERRVQTNDDGGFVITPFFSNDSSPPNFQVWLPLTQVTTSRTTWFL